MCSLNIACFSFSSVRSCLHEELRNQDYRCICHDERRINVYNGGVPSGYNYQQYKKQQEKKMEPTPVSTSATFNESDRSDLLFCALRTLASDLRSGNSDTETIPTGSLFCKCAAIPGQHELRKNNLLGKAPVVASQRPAQCRELTVPVPVYSRSQMVVVRRE